MVLATLKRLTDELRAVLTDLDPDRLSGSDASKLLDTFTDLEKLAAGGKLLTARRVESSNVWRSKGHRSAASHIAEVSGTGIGPAIHTLQAARQLAGLPAAEEAVRKGRLSEVQVKEIASAASLLPEAEGELVTAAVEEPLNLLKLRCRRAKATGKGQGPTYRAIHRSRYLRNWIDDDGAVRLDAKLTPDAGARLLGAVKAQRERLAADARRAGVKEPSRALAADALVRLVCRSGRPIPGIPADNRVDGAAPGRGARPTANRRPSNGRPPAKTKRREAADDPSAHGSDNDIESAPHTMVHVRVDHAALLRGHTEHGEVCEIPGIGPIPISVARELAGDSILSVLVTDGVDVTTVAHAGRTIPASIRRALLERDPACVVPGCEVSEALEIDHIVPFSEGGRTSIDNLARLCHWHHYLKTHQRHRLERHGRRWVWIPPDGNHQGVVPRSDLQLE
jgi:HNH endonuclease